MARLCGNLPLALLIAAALLRAHGRAWTLDHLITRLAAARPGRELAPFDDGTRNLTALFDVSYHALPAGLQQFYRRLGVLPGPEIDGYAAAALTASDLEQAEAHLGQLAGCSLLEAASPGRYRMHDLLRAHARTLATTDPGSGEEARARLHHYYQHTARRAATLTTLTPRPGPGGPAPAYAPPLPGPASAWAWLRAERANLQAAIDHAGRHGLGPDLITLTAGLAHHPANRRPLAPGRDPASGSSRCRRPPRRLPGPGRRPRRPRGSAPADGRHPWRHRRLHPGAAGLP